MAFRQWFRTVKQLFVLMKYLNCWITIDSVLKATCRLRNRRISDYYSFTKIKGKTWSSYQK